MRLWTRLYGNESLPYQCCFLSWDSTVCTTCSNMYTLMNANHSFLQHFCIIFFSRPTGHIDIEKQRHESWVQRNSKAFPQVRVTLECNSLLKYDVTFAGVTTIFLTRCSPSLTIGTCTHLPNSTFGTDKGPNQNELNPIVLHLWTQWHCLELSVHKHSLNPHCQLQVNFLPFHCYWFFI